MGFLQTERNHLIVTPNPEMVMLAQANAGFMRILQNADLVLADGIGIILAARWRGLPISVRVTGCDTALELLKTAALEERTCYLLGAAPGVAEQARQNLQQQGIRVIGAHDGFFSDDSEILEEIRGLAPDILIVGMGMPRQEEWAARHLDTLPCKITLCLGGSIDIYAGNVRRAPAFLRRIGLEWFYRLVTNPSRAMRMLSLPKFALTVLIKRK